MRKKKRAFFIGRKLSFRPACPPSVLIQAGKLNPPRTICTRRLGRARHFENVMIFRCQPGFEPNLEKELRLHGIVATELGSGWLRAEKSAAALPELCFAYAVLLDPVELAADTVNGLAGKILDYFLGSAKDERFEATWPLIFDMAASLDGLGRRVDGVEKALIELLRKRLSRVAKLATPEKPRGIAKARGLFVFFADFGRLFVARECVFGGQRRMADDSLAPSRSYLKVEEAYIVLEIGR